MLFRNCSFSFRCKNIITFLPQNSKLLVGVNVFVRGCYGNLFRLQRPLYPGCTSPLHCCDSESHGSSGWSGENSEIEKICCCFFFNDYWFCLMTGEALPALLVIEHQRAAKTRCWCRLAVETAKNGTKQIWKKPNKLMCLCNSSGQEQHQSECSPRNIEKQTTNAGFSGQKMWAFNLTKAWARDNNRNPKSVYFAYVPCGENADSGCRQSAEFHIQPWTGHQTELQPSPICWCASASAPTARAGLVGLGSVFG